ncbi:MAG: serine/threonine-protein kinase [Gaiellaceae bacterium]
MTAERPAPLDAKQEEGRPQGAPPAALEVDEPERAQWEFAEGDEIVPGRMAVKLLGSGERYETYLAWEERLLSFVVVKIVRPDLVEDDHALRGLAGEVRLLERLAHPVLMRAFAAVLDGPRPHVVLEHLEGPRLSTLIRKYGPLEHEQLLPLGLQLCSALHFVATEEVVHLDVKPSNIIMGAPARLIDLSIALTFEELEHVRSPIGTDAYMPPEQCDPRERGPITSAADIWGMGATLYHAAAGSRPFSEGSREGAGEARFPQLTEEPAPLPKSVPSEVAGLILSCLNPDPGARPVAAEVAATLEPLVDTLPRRPVLARFRVRPLRERHRSSGLELP